MNFLLLPFLLSTMISEMITASTTYYLEDFNNGDLDMTARGVNDFILRLGRFTSYGSSQTKTLTVRTSASHRLSVRVISFSLGSCTGSTLSLYNYGISSSEAIATGLCRSPASEYLSRGSQLIVRYESNGSSIGRSFQLIVTSFQSPNGGSCNSGYYNCGNNRCIKQDIVCNSQNNCGNNQDEACSSAITTDSSSSIGWIALFIVAAAVGIVFYYIKNKRFPWNRRFHRTQGESGTPGRVIAQHSGPVPRNPGPVPRQTPGVQRAVQSAAFTPPHVPLANPIRPTRTHVSPDNQITPASNPAYPPQAAGHQPVQQRYPPPPPQHQPHQSPPGLPPPQTPSYPQSSQHQPHQSPPGHPPPPTPFYPQSPQHQPHQPPPPTRYPPPNERHQPQPFQPQNQAAPYPPPNQDPPLPPPTGYHPPPGYPPSASGYQTPSASAPPPPYPLSPPPSYSPPPDKSDLPPPYVHKPPGH